MHLYLRLQICTNLNMIVICCLEIFSPLLVVDGIQRSRLNIIQIINVFSKLRWPVKQFKVAQRSRNDTSHACVKNERYVHTQTYAKHGVDIGYAVIYDALHIHTKYAKYDCSIFVS